MQIHKNENILGRNFREKWFFIAFVRFPAENPLISPKMSHFLLGKIFPAHNIFIFVDLHHQRVYLHTGMCVHSCSFDDPYDIRNNSGLSSAAAISIVPILKVYYYYYCKGCLRFFCCTVGFLLSGIFFGIDSTI